MAPRGMLFVAFAVPVPGATCGPRPALKLIFECWLTIKQEKKNNKRFYVCKTEKGKLCSQFFWEIVFRVGPSDVFLRAPECFQAITTSHDQINFFSPARVRSIRKASVGPIFSLSYKFSYQLNCLSNYVTLCTIRSIKLLISFLLLTHLWIVFFKVHVRCRITN